MRYLELITSGAVDVETFERWFRHDYEKYKPVRKRLQDGIGLTDEELIGLIEGTLTFKQIVEKMG